MEKFKRRQIGTVGVFGMVALLATGPAIAGNGDDSTAVSSPAFHYKPFSETEIAFVVQRPLGLDDCIRIALRKNIAYRLSQAELSKAEASHAGSYGQFLPVLVVEGTKTNSLLREQRLVLPDTVAQFVDSRFDNNASVVGRFQQYLPTGATFEISSDWRRDVSIPLVQSSQGLTPASKDFDPTTKARNYTYGLSFRQPLLRGAWPEVARSEVTTTEYSRQIQEKSLFNDELLTVFGVKSAFYNVLRDNQLVKVNAAAIKSDSVLVQSSQAMVKAQLATRRDVLSAEIRLLDDRTSLIKSQNDYQRSLDLLKDAMGLPLEMAIAVVDSELSYFPIQFNEAALTRAAVENNPAIKSAEVSIQRSRLQLTVKKNSLLPQLDLVASYFPNRTKDLIQNVDLSRTGGWEAGFVLNYPFLNRSASAEVEIAQIALSQEQDRLADLQRQIFLQVRDIVRSVYSSAEEINAIQRNIEVAEEKLNFASTMFNLGRASNLDITDAQEALLKAQNKYVSKLADYHTQLALLESLTGQPITPAR